MTEKLIRKEAKEMLKKIKKKEGSLLDIGCGAGFYLNEAQKVGFSVTGVEMSGKLTKYVRKNFGIHVFNENFMEAKISPLRFDVIVLSQVIEHLTDPLPTLRKIRSLLRKNGIFYLATPNIDSWLYDVQKESFPYMIPPEHVYFYSPKALKILLTKMGFEIVLLNTYGYQQDLAGIIKSLLGKKSVVVNAELHEVPDEYPRNPIKLFKYLIFDKLFCGSLFPLLNFGNRGSMIRIVARRKT